MAKKSTAAQASLDRIEWAIGALARSQGTISTANVAQLCTEKFGGPRAQSISNDAKGYAQLVKLAAAAHRPPAGAPVRASDQELLARVADPQARAEILATRARLAAAQADVSALRRALRRLAPIAALSAELASARVESLEALAERVELCKRPVGVAFDSEERVAVCHLLKSLSLEGLHVDEESGEILTASGRTFARRGVLSALRKISRMKAEVSLQSGDVTVDQRK